VRAFEESAAEEPTETNRQAVAKTTIDVSRMSEAITDLHTKLRVSYSARALAAERRVVNGMRLKAYR
jgi:hypothetical protein